MIFAAPPHVTVELKKTKARPIERISGTQREFVSKAGGDVVPGSDVVPPPTVHQQSFAEANPQHNLTQSTALRALVSPHRQRSHEVPPDQDPLKIGGHGSYRSITIAAASQEPTGARRVVRQLSDPSRGYQARVITPSICEQSGLSYLRSSLLSA